MSDTDHAIDQSDPSRALGWLAWGLFGLAVVTLVGLAASIYLLMDLTSMADHRPDSWYGNWRAVLFSAAFFSLFVLGLLRSPHQREWRHLGAAEAYLVALFTEMYGIPLTIYLLGSTLGVNVGFGVLEGHLWAVLLDRLGWVSLARGVGLVMAASSALIIVGLALMLAGWWQTWRARGNLVTTGLYRFVRHPQYFGFLLLTSAFLIQWPTLPTLVMFPVLLVVYVRLARREERVLATRLGESWAAYRARTPMLVPGWPTRTHEGTVPDDVSVGGRR